MTASDVGYDRLYTWIKPRLGPVHATVCRTVAWAVLCLLLAQRATPAVLARALPAEQAGSGRACLRRVRRWWNGPPLDQAHVSPQLVQMARQCPAARRPRRRGAGHHPLGRVGSLAGRDRGGWAHATHRLGGHPLSLAEGALPGHDPGAHPAAPTRLPGRGALDAGGRPRLPQRRALRPVAPGGHGLQRAAAAERLGDGGGVYATGGGPSGGRPPRRGPADRARRWAVDGPTSRWCRAGSSSARRVAAPPKHKQNPGTARERAKRAKAHAQHRAHKQGRKTTPPSAVAQRYAQTWVPVHHRADRDAGGGGVCRAHGDRRDLSGIGIIIGPCGRPWSACRPRRWSHG